MSRSPAPGRGGSPEPVAGQSRRREPLTGVLLVGGASSRFGSPKALARLGATGGEHGPAPGDETLAGRAWRILAGACDETIAVGKTADGLALPFPLLDDGTARRAPIAGVVAGLRAARHDLCVVLPVDCPLVDAELLHALAAACTGDAAHPPAGPLPGAFRRSALPALEAALAAGELSLWRAIAGLDVAVASVDEAKLADVDEPADLEALRAARAATS